MNIVEVVSDLVYQEDLGTAGTLDLYYPKIEKSEVLLIFFHGGGLEGGDKTDESGVYKELASNGITVVSANYRIYPEAKFPEYLEDAAKAVAWSLQHVQEYIAYDKVFIGGISAGSYISMMLHFQTKFLAENQVEENKISGYIFDAGQPTTHYNVLKERGMDCNSVRVDEAAPIYYLEGEQKNIENQRFLVLVASNDIPGRREQNELLMRTMETHGYKKEQMEYRIIDGYEHAGYENVVDENGKYPYVKLLLEFIGSHM